MALLCGHRIFFLSSSRIHLFPPLSRNNVYAFSTQQRVLVGLEMGARRFLRIRAQAVSTSSTASPTLMKSATSPSTSTPSEDSPFTSLSPLERLRARQLRDVVKHLPAKSSPAGKSSGTVQKALAVSFDELGLSDELMSALRELGISKPTEVQSLGIPSVLAGENVVMASHTGSGKTLAYMLPIIQMLRRDEADSGKATRVRRPRCVVLCPTRELAEQVFHVAKSICHHARFRAAMIGGGTRMKAQEDVLNTAVDMIVGTPGRLLMHIKEGHMAYGDIKYVALDEADTMFDRGFAPEIRKFLGPLRNRSRQPGDPGIQTVLVTATITKAVQKILDEEFPGIRHIQTSTLHKKVASARHDFLKLSGTENKLEALTQVLEPSLAKGNHCMVFCNTLNSCRAVDHHLNENGIKTVNYHGEVPADERVENLTTFKEAQDGSVPALVCTDLAARGLDLVVDHVFMFDFPYNPIDYLHRTGRTARMGAKGRVTSLVTKRDLTLALQIEDAMSQGKSLEALTSSRETLELRKQQELLQKRRQKSMEKDDRGNFKTAKFKVDGKGQSVSRIGSSMSKSGSKKTSSSTSKPLKGTRGKARFGSSDKKVQSSTKKPVAFSMRKNKV
ncbi:unnamed protein product [Calypogeia fissa]